MLQAPPLKVAKAAQELDVSIHTVRAWIAQRRIGHVRLGRSIRIPAAEIERLLEAGFVPARRSA
jgi:excisionase family DNA binding protein